MVICSIWKEEKEQNEEECCRVCCDGGGGDVLLLLMATMMIVTTTFPFQANGQMVCTVEANGDPKNGGGTTNGQVPLLRSYKRRLHMRRSSTRDGVRRQCQASQPLRTETVQEQEI